MRKIRLPEIKQLIIEEIKSVVISEDVNDDHEFILNQALAGAKRWRKLVASSTWSKVDPEHVEELEHIETKIADLEAQLDALSERLPASGFAAR